MNPENQAIPAPSGEAELIVRAQGGEEKAFEELFHAHQRRVYYLCLRMIRNAAEAEELTPRSVLLGDSQYAFFVGAHTEN